MATQEQLQVAKDALIRFTLRIDNSDIGGGDGAQGKLSAQNPALHSDTNRNFFFGNVRNFTLPDIKQKNALWPTMGDGQMKIDIGVEELMLSFTSARFNPGIRAMYGKYVTAILKSGLWQGDTSRHNFYTVEGSGRVEQVTGSQVSSGELPDGITVMINCLKYVERIRQAGQSESENITFVDIDIPQFKRMVDGESQLDELKSFFEL